MLAVAQLGSAQPTIGADWLLLSFAAPIIGGAALTGGYISVLGTMFAVVLIALIENGMVLAKVDPYWVQFLLGALILAAVVAQPLARGPDGDGLRCGSPIESASKSFPGVQALDGVSLDLQPGEIHALMGENGAGKSTLIKIITGVYRPDERPGAPRRPRGRSSLRRATRIAAGIGAVHQERNLIPRFSVGENILLERLPTRNGLVDYAEVDREARRYLDLLDRGIDTRVEVRTLSVAQMQIVEIAKALSLEAKILLLDEPTASITEHETAALFTLLRRLRDDGVAIVFVSHKLEEVFAIADRVTVLRDGKNAADRRADGRDDAAEAGVADDRPRGAGRQAPRARGSTAPTSCCEARGLSTSLGHRDIDFSLQRGEILGLYGLVGAGRSELAQAILGDGEITGGELLVRGEAGAHPRHARGARRATASAMSARTARRRG